MFLINSLGWLLPFTILSLASPPSVVYPNPENATVGTLATTPPAHFSMFNPFQNLDQGVLSCLVTSNNEKRCYPSLDIGLRAIPSRFNFSDVVAVDLSPDAYMTVKWKTNSKPREATFNSSQRHGDAGSRPVNERGNANGTFFDDYNEALDDKLNGMLTFDTQHPDPPLVCIESFLESEKFAALDPVCFGPGAGSLPDINSRSANIILFGGANLVSWSADGGSNGKFKLFSADSDPPSISFNFRNSTQTLYQGSISEIAVLAKGPPQDWAQYLSDPRKAVAFPPQPG